MKNNLLVITNLYPYKNSTHSSTFNEQQIAHLSEYFEKVFIICPIPWTGFVRGYYKPYTKMYKKNEKITVFYPIYYYTPGILRSLYWLFYLLSILPFVLRLKKSQKLDRLFATWLYPDGFSAFWISKIFKIPLTVKAHGSDVNIYATKKTISVFYKYYLNRCKAVITVSEDLKEKLIKLGIHKEKIKTIYNGIDLDKFSIDNDPAHIKSIFNRSNKNIIYIGNLKSSKGIFDVLDFYQQYKLNERKIDLYYLGEGPDGKKLKKEINNLNLTDHVKLLGKISHSKIPLYLNAADFLILLSENEGIPNVMLEAFACGTPVIIKNVGGVNEFFKNSISGIYYDKINTDNIDLIFSKTYNLIQIRNIVSNLTWEKSAHEIFKTIYSNFLK